MYWPIRFDGTGADGCIRDAEGVSGALGALGGLVLMVLMIACANVANLMTAQASARAREMALRVSIGAGRWRLVQMVLVQSASACFSGGCQRSVVCVVVRSICGEHDQSAG